MKKRRVLLMGAGLLVLACLLAAGWWYYEATSVRQPDFDFSIQSPYGPGSYAHPAQPGEPIVISVETRFPASHKDTLTSKSAILNHFSGLPPYHPLEFLLHDPDGLASLWRRTVDPEEYSRIQGEWFQASPKPFAMSCDLRQWAPAWFDWPTGHYRITCSSRPKWGTATSNNSWFFLGISSPVPPPPPELLKATIESNKTHFAPGELIVLRGFLENVGHKTFFVQTRLPFREARLTTAYYGGDWFPKVPQSGPLRLSDFTRLEPGQKVAFFSETFVAGTPDPHWVIGCRSEALPQPFWGTRWTVYLTMDSIGLIPEDRQPNAGIWSGHVESNHLELTCDKPK